MNELSLLEIAMVAAFVIVLTGLVGALRALVDWWKGGRS